MHPARCNASPVHVTDRAAPQYLSERPVRVRSRPRIAPHVPNEVRVITAAVRLASRPFVRSARQACLALLVLVAGCDGMDDPLSRRERRELTSARARWNSSPVRTAYRYDLRVLCFCPPEITNWNTITVIDGLITGVVNERGEPVPRERWNLYSTVDRLFFLLDQPKNEYLEDITVKFDAQYGHPVEISYIYSQGIADAGAVYSARNLQPMARTTASGER